MRSIADDVRHLPLLPRDAINAYLIGDVLVDTGLKQSERRLLGLLEGRSISAIAITHAHIDHAGSMKRLAARLGIPVWCGTADREAVESGHPVPSRRLSRPRLAGFVDATAGFDGAPVARTLAEGDALAAGFTVLRHARPLSRARSFGGRRTGRRPAATFLQPAPAHDDPGPAPAHRPLHALAGPEPGVRARPAELEPRTVGFGHGPVLPGRRRRPRGCASSWPSRRRASGARRAAGRTRRCRAARPGTAGASAAAPRA